MIPQQTVNLILDTAQIVDVVSDYVTLKRRGASYVACCPFHSERTPSFYVTPSKGIYKCFGCGKAGSAVGFVMEQEHCGYQDALRYLARKYNIEIVETEVSPEELALRQKRESLLQVSEYARNFFSETLKSGEGRSVGYAYFRSRGIEDATIEKFGLGWAPGKGLSLVEAAVKAGYKPEYLVDAGLAVLKDDGSLVDKFRERVMFPIHSVSGRVIAFSGRTLCSDNPAKYVNSPETEIYTKSRNLLGIWFAKSEISRQDKCIIVEGNIDMVMMHQLGISNVVASCGTALTSEQVRLIHKFTENVTIMYDGDAAGMHAAMRGLELILSEGMNVKVVSLPEGEDPDSFCRKHSLEEVRDYISSNEKDFVSLKTSLLLDEAAGDPLKKARLINDIADTIALIPDAVKRSTYVEFTASSFGIESQILFDRISSQRRKLIEDKRAQEDREKRRNKESLMAPEPVSGERVEQEPKVAEAWIEENKLLSGPEKELLGFILSHGRDIMEFESDSEFYSGDEEEKLTVAEFIRVALESDGSEFANSVYRAAYNAYFEAYDKELSQDEIIKTLLDSPDRNVAALTAALYTDKYVLTVSSFRNSLTTTQSWLVTQVPKTLLFYYYKKLKEQIENLRKELSVADESGQLEIAQQIKKIKSTQMRIRQKMGRDKFEH